MTRFRTFTALAPMVALLVAALIARASQAADVSLDGQAQQRLGLSFQRLAPAHQAGEVDAFAKVLDPEPLVQLVSDLETAEAAALASGAEAKRAAALHSDAGGVATKDLEAAVAQARADALKVDMLHRRLFLEWGPGVARLSPAARKALVADLTKGAAALVHVDTHNNDGQGGAKHIRIDVGDGSLRGVVLGPARAAEPRLQSSGLIVEVKGASAILLSVGLTQSAHIETASAQSGVIVPRAAVIRYQGSDWVYVKTTPDRFSRRLVLNPVPEAEGLFVAQGLSPGDVIVNKGAAAIFAAEMSLAHAVR